MVNSQHWSQGLPLFQGSPVSDNRQASFQTVVHNDLHLVDQCIHEQLCSGVALVNNIGEYIIKSGGKRLRPLVVLLSARACGYQGSDHIALAAIIELLHTATLLHDDVVDKSTLRRGHESANAVWGNAACVLVGDYLYSHTFQMLVKLGDLQLLEVLAHAISVVAEGEVMQLMNIHNANVSEEKYMEVIRCKTAMLFQAACETAAILSKGNPEIKQALAAYGNYLGIAFQLADDLLDYDGDSQAMGKSLGDDLAEGKTTLPLIYVLQHGSQKQQSIVCRVIEQGGRGELSEIQAIIRSSGALDYTAEKARFWAEKALDSLRSLPESQYKSAMIDLARFVIARTH